MNIVFVCSEYPYHENQPTGGFGRYVEIIIKGLAAFNHKVTVLCRVEKKLPVINRDGATIVPLVVIGTPLLKLLVKLFPVRLSYRLVSFLEYPLLWSLTVWLTLKQLDSKKKIDIIEGGDFGAELFFYLLLEKNKPVTIVKLHTPTFVIRQFNNEPKTIFHFFMEPMERFCLHKATALNSPSKSLAKIVSKDIKRPVSVIIPYPVRKKKLKFKRKRKPYLSLYVGKFQHKKGIFFLLKAIPFIIKSIPQARFIFVGPDTIWQGRSTQKLMKDYIAEKNIEKNVTILRQCSQDELISLYQQAAVTVIPSLWENFPYACLEAMSFGSAVVASDTSGLKEIMTGKKIGLLVKPGDPRELATAVVFLLQHSRRRESMIKAAQRMVKSKYSEKKITRNTFLFYKRY